MFEAETRRTMMLQKLSTRGKVRHVKTDDSAPPTLGDLHLYRSNTL